MDFISKTIKQFESATSTADENTLVLDTDKGIRKIAISDFKKGIGAGVAPQVPDATTDKKGIVKQATKVDPIGVADAVTAKGEYTQGDIEGMVTLINKNKERINEILSALKTAGIMKSN